MSQKSAWKTKDLAVFELVWGRWCCEEPEGEHSRHEDQYTRTHARSPIAVWHRGSWYKAPIVLDTALFGRSIHSTLVRRNFKRLRLLVLERGTPFKTGSACVLTQKVLTINVNTAPKLEQTFRHPFQSVLEFCRYSWPIPKLCQLSSCQLLSTSIRVTYV